MTPIPVTYYEKPTTPENKYVLTAPLLSIMDEKWTIGDACEGVQIFGGTGSGKTSGSGQMLAKTYLYNGFGGLVLTVKAGDSQMWTQYCEQLHRSDHLMIVNESEQFKFNFLDYLVKEEYSTVNITHIFLSALQKHNAGDYWQNAMEQLIKNSINLLILATGTVSIQQMYKLVLNAPKSQEEADLIFEIEELTQNPEDVAGVETENQAKKEIEVVAENEYKARQNAPLIKLNTSAKLELKNLQTGKTQKINPYFRNLFVLAQTKVDLLRSSLADQDPATFIKHKNLILEFTDLTSLYWQSEFPAMDSEPRSSIISMFTSLADNLLRGELRSILSCEPSEQNFSPDSVLEGKILVLDLNIKRFRETGKMAQIIFKTIFQMTVEKKRESVVDKASLRPIFLWIDEAQFFLTKDDVLFQTTARSSKVCSVYLTQNYSNYLAFVGSHREKATVDSFLAVLQTKFFHCQGDPVTNNDYVTALIGKDYQEQQTANTSIGGVGGEGSSRSVSKALDYKILPWHFDQLAKGGAFNDNKVEAYVYQSGRIWTRNKDNFGLVIFDQEV